MNPHPIPLSWSVPGQLLTSYALYLVSAGPITHCTPQLPLAKQSDHIAFPRTKITTYRESQAHSIYKVNISSLPLEPHLKKEQYYSISHGFLFVCLLGIMK